MVNISSLSNWPGIDLMSKFELDTLVIKSKALQSNRLKDSPVKTHFVLKPTTSKRVPVVYHLSGFYGDGLQQMNNKSGEMSLPQRIVEMTVSGELPEALHIFVNAMTSVGGSQFIESEYCGDYSSHLTRELPVAIKNHYKVSDKESDWVLIGTSSGGYGALHLISLTKSPFGKAISIAPDSFFEASILPEFYTAAPYLEPYLKVSHLVNSIKSGELAKKKKFFQILNTCAMALCYNSVEKGKIVPPIDLKTGLLNTSAWKQWKSNDPVVFLKKRLNRIQDKQIFLEVGLWDEFHLQMGARQIADILRGNIKKFKFEEFKGGHFRLRENKLRALQKVL